jgi:hypothetical protein
VLASRTCPAQKLIAEHVHKAGFLGNGNKDIRRDIPESIALPTRQRLEPDDAVAIERDKRLVVGDDEIGSDRASEFTFDLDAPIDVGIHLRLEEANRRTAGFFGTIKGAVGAPEQLVGLGAVIRRYGDAATGTKLHRRAIDHKRFSGRGCDTPGQIRRLFERLDFGHDDCELVATHSRKDRIRAQNGGDSLSKLAQCSVSHGVAMGVVNLLETIQVKHENGRTLRIADAAKTFIKLFPKNRRLGNPVKGSWRASL